MEVTFLGTGTSHGIPVITCNCKVCRSEDPRNRRYRSSLHIKTAKTSIIIDTTPEFRLQVIRTHINSVDGVLYTHVHADHLHGIDDLRPYSKDRDVTIFGRERDLLEIKERFPYIFGTTLQLGGGKPQLICNPIENSFYIDDLNITPIPIKHGKLDIYGYRLGNVAYLTDCNYIPEESYKLLENLDTLIIGALRYREHSTHFNIDQAIEEIKKINPKNAYLTHLCHDVDHEELLNYLNHKSKKEGFIKKIKPAHDGLCLNLID